MGGSRSCGRGVGLREWGWLLVAPWLGLAAEVVEGLDFAGGECAVVGADVVTVSL